jgi:hypothetical protein
MDQEFYVGLTINTAGRYLTQKIVFLEFTRRLYAPSSNGRPSARIVKVIDEPNKTGHYLALTQHSETWQNAKSSQGKKNSDYRPTKADAAVGVSARESQGEEVNPYEPPQKSEKILVVKEKHTAIENIATIALVFAVFGIIWYIFRP